VGKHNRNVINPFTNTPVTMLIQNYSRSSLLYNVFFYHYQLRFDNLKVIEIPTMLIAKCAISCFAC